MSYYYGSGALLWHNAKVLALSKVLTLIGYNQNFFLINPILMKIGEVVVPIGSTTTSPSFVKIRWKTKKFWLLRISVSTLESANTLALCQSKATSVLLSELFFTRSHMTFKQTIAD